MLNSKKNCVIRRKLIKTMLVVMILTIMNDRNNQNHKLQLFVVSAWNLPIVKENMGTKLSFTQSRRYHHSFFHNDEKSLTAAVTTKNSSSINTIRRREIIGIMISIITTTIYDKKVCEGKNLPDIYTKIDTNKVGSIETLLPIIQIKKSMENIENQLLLLQQQQQQQSSLSSSPTSFDSTVVVRTNIYESVVKKKEKSNNDDGNSIRVPIEETNFKAVFDAYSDPVSYKQKFLNQNAFLVYYTKGYDGPSRPNIENDDTLIKQTIQYGTRNEAWISWNEFIIELQYQIRNPNSINNDDNIQDLIKPLSNSIAAINNYLNQVPINDINTCNELLLKAS